MINQRIFSANVGEPSTGNKGPDAIEQDIDNLLANDQEFEAQINSLVADITEYDFAYINNLVKTPNIKNKYWKNKFGEVTMVGSYQMTGTSDDIPNGTIIFNLPVGFRPAEELTFPCRARIVNGSVLAGLTIKTNGDCIVYMPTNVKYMNGIFSCSFIAV